MKKVDKRKIDCDNSKVNLATFVEGDPKAPFSIAPFSSSSLPYTSG